MIKKSLICFVCLLLGISTLSTAQEAEKFRADIRLGYATGAEGNGLLLSVEPKWTIDTKMVVGFRISSSGLFQDAGVDSQNGAALEQYNGAGSFTGTFDYYFHHKKGSPFASFVGGGLGLYSNISYVDFKRANIVQINEIDGSDGFGGFARIGFDYFKFRVALEYNVAPKGVVRDFQNTNLRESKNSYLGFSLGFYFGGGKWKRNGIDSETKG